MKPSQVRQLSDTEIVQHIADARTELFNLRFGRATGNLENPMRFRVLKKDIARYLTVLRERELAEEAQGR